jgi:hypothetical protein
LMTLLVGFAIAYLTLADGGVLLEQIKVELPVRVRIPRNTALQTKQDE